MELQLTSHEDVVKLRESVSMTYAWDFILAPGDTITEKYTHLFNFLSASGVRKSGKPNEAAVIANKKIIGMIEPMASLLYKEALTPSYKPMGELMYCSEYSRSCGPHGYEAGFHMIADEDCPDDEILVYAENKTSVVKLFNIII